MRPPNLRDSRTRFCSKGPPRCHFPASDIPLINLRGLLALPSGDRVQRSPLPRPTREIVVGINPRDQTNAAPVQGPNPPFSIGPEHSRTPAVLREEHPGEALRSDGLGISTVHINQVVPCAVPRFNARGQQPLAVW